jgi:BarA-like signal transduction histidine kinase
MVMAVITVVHVRETITVIDMFLLYLPSHSAAYFEKLKQVLQSLFKSFLQAV